MDNKWKYGALIGLGAAAVAGAAIATVLILKSREAEEETREIPEEDAENDAILVDLDGDGEVDTVLVDTTGDGEADTVMLDTTGDGEVDTILVDTTGDGELDTIYSDNAELLAALDEAEAAGEEPAPAE